MRKKHMLAELDTSLILGEGDPDLGDAESVYGSPVCTIRPTAYHRFCFRVTRSKREFNPHVIQPEVLTTLKVQSEWLLREGHRISEAAWADAVEEDTEVFDTAVRLDTSLPLSTPTPTTLKPLEGLLRPVDLQPQAKHPRYIPNMALTAAARRKVKGHHRATIQQQLGTGLKAVAIRKGIETQPGPQYVHLLARVQQRGWAVTRQYHIPKYIPYRTCLLFPGFNTLSGMPVTQDYKSEDGLHWAALLGYSGDGMSWLKNAECLDELLLQAHQSLQFPKHAQ
ncbi:hypothetical protein EV359DRAFT_86477 [Lentinula novae-zelandiae]|nr:hypothetical protein EV359DRAFT_86477 [Lentinula novae-zelandiae]